MEQTEIPEHKRGGIHNYFQGATINNIVIVQRNQYNGSVGQVLENVEKVVNPG